jgi:hypothetical protein
MGGGEEVKKTIVTATAVGLAVLAITAPSPIAAPEASPTLAQFNALKNRVTSAERKIASLQRDMNCIDDEVYPVTQYGDSGVGYVYADLVGQNAIITTALDRTIRGEVPDAWLAEVDPDCVEDGPTARFHRAADSAGAAKAVKLSRRG